MYNMKDASKLVIKVEQRNGRKAWTTIENLQALSVDNDELKQLVKYLKKKLSCNGCLKKNKDDTFYILFQGKHADALKEILEEKKLISSDKINVIGDF